MRNVYLNNVANDDFNMILAFLFASFGAKEEGAILSDSELFIGSSSTDEPCELSAVKNCLAKSKHMDLARSILYLSYVPSLDDIKDMISFEVRQLIYFPWEDLSQESAEVAYKGRVSVTPFIGNLNWVRDRLNDLKKMGIFHI
jgi:hypothetical protein